jgi:diaminopimelate epimerase
MRAMTSETQPSGLPFMKMHGLGNDFVVLDFTTRKHDLTPSDMRALADRRTGIGFDQLLIAEVASDPEKMDFRYRIFNADGTEAEQCGNGARCFFRFVLDRGLTTLSRVTLETSTGAIECQLEPDGEISVNMGPPQLQPEKIPFLVAKTDGRQRAGAAVVHTLRVRPGGGRRTSVALTVVNMGNPHAVIVVSDVATAEVAELGPLIENHVCFPSRVNVGFMQIVDRGRVNLRVFERGVGETRACGSGSCAAVVAGRLQGRLDSRVEVSLPGGLLKISWEGGEEDPVMMTGPACRVYDGQMTI